MNELEQLMARQRELMNVWLALEGCWNGTRVYSIGTVLNRDGSLTMPVYARLDGERIADIVMGADGQLETFEK